MTGFLWIGCLIAGILLYLFAPSRKHCPSCGYRTCGWYAPTIKRGCCEAYFNINRVQSREDRSRLPFYERWLTPRVPVLWPETYEELHDPQRKGFVAPGPGVILVSRRVR